jgi:protein phosphatase
MCKKSRSNPRSKGRYNDKIPMCYLHGNAQHIGSRRHQQDSFGFSDGAGQAFQSHGGFLAVVCDGMGGMEHGDIASQTAVRTVIEAYVCKTPQESIPQALERSVQQANERVFAIAKSLGVAGAAGTTLVAGVLHGTSLYYISVGDSALFHLSRGRLRMISRPHVYADLLEQAVASGSLSREAAANHPVRDGETVLLATDGLFKTLDGIEMLSCLTGDPLSWPGTLVQRTLDKREQGQDNVTVVAVTLQSAPRTSSIAGWWRRWWS